MILVWVNRQNINNKHYSNYACKGNFWDNRHKHVNTTMTNSRSHHLYNRRKMQHNPIVYIPNLFNLNQQLCRVQTESLIIVIHNGAQQSVGNSTQQSDSLRLTPISHHPHIKQHQKTTCQKIKRLNG